MDSVLTSSTLTPYLKNPTFFFFKKSKISLFSQNPNKPTSNPHNHPDSYKPFSSFVTNLCFGGNSLGTNSKNRTFLSKKTRISVFSENPAKPDSNSGSNRKPNKPFSSFVTRLCFGSYPDGRSPKFLQNGSFGVALLSVTANAKVRISPFVAKLAANPTFVSGFFAWFVAQFMKVVLHFCFEKKLDLRIMCASGGMPSSHSALCTALTTSVAICHGVADSLFPVCLGFSLIVMYDAIGVRRHAGMQAEVLNLIVEDLFQGHPISKRKLKELLGHTPSQVVAGAVLGIVVACICTPGCFVPI